MKIKHEKLKNCKHNFPVVGIQEIDANGIVEITDEKIAQKLLELPEWSDAAPKPAAKKSIVVNKAAKKVVVAEPDPEDEEASEEESEDSPEEDESENEETEEAEEEEMDEEQHQALIDSLDGMTLEQLIEMAEQSEIKGWRNFKTSKKMLASFLKKKL